MEKDMQGLLFFHEYEAFYSMAAKSDVPIRRAMSCPKRTM